MPIPHLADLLAESERLLRRDGRVGLAQIVRVEGSTAGKVGWKMLIGRDGTATGNLGGGAFEALVQADLGEKVAERFSEPQVKRYYMTESAARGEPTGMACGGLADVFLEVLTARPLLVVCGGGPVGQAVAAHATLTGFDVLVAEDRAEYRRAELFPEGCELAEVSRGYDEDFLAPFVGRELYVAVVTRCWETDRAALESVLRQRPEHLVYLGLMGSRRKIEKVSALLEERGDGLDGVPFHAPIGLPIGGDQPGEIGLSIVAEVVQCREAARRPAADLRGVSEGGVA